MVNKPIFGSQTGNDASNAEDAALLKKYCRYMKLAKNFSENTLKAYTDDLQKLVDYAASEKLALVDVRLDDLRHFAAELIDMGISPRSLGVFSVE